MKFLVFDLEFLLKIYSIFYEFGWIFIILTLFAFFYKVYLLERIDNNINNIKKILLLKNLNDDDELDFLTEEEKKMIDEL